MSVTAKFRCSHITVGDGWREVRFLAVYSDDKNSENYSWSKWTPCGYIVMSITNPAAYSQFEQGKEYLLKFDPVATSGLVVSETQ